MEDLGYALQKANRGRSNTLKKLRAGKTTPSLPGWKKRNEKKKKAKSQRNKILGLLKCTFGKCSEAIITGYKAMVHPIVEYACPVWNPHQQYLSEKKIWKNPEEEDVIKLFSQRLPKHVFRL